MQKVLCHLRNQAQGFDFNYLSINCQNCSFFFLKKISGLSCYGAILSTSWATLLWSWGSQILSNDSCILHIIFQNKQWTVVFSNTYQIINLSITEVQFYRGITPKCSIVVVFVDVVTILTLASTALCSK